MKTKAARNKQRPEGRKRYVFDMDEMFRRERQADRPRRDAITAKRLASRAANTKYKTVRRPVNRDRKPAAFYVSPKIRRRWFPDRAHWWYARYFVHLIRWREITWRANTDGFSQLLYRFLERMIPRAVLKRVKKILIDERRVVKCDGLAIKGQKAFGYKLARGYRMTRRVVCKNKALNRRIWRVQAETEQALLPVHRWLKDKLPLVVESDLEGALAVIATLKPKKKRKPGSRPLTVAEYRRQREDNFRRIVACDHWFQRDEYGRVHTPLTALERKLVPSLRVRENGVLCPLVEIDIVNSQPLLLCKLAL